MDSFFFYGTLCHLPLLRVVLGRDVVPVPAELPGHSVHWAAGEAFPILSAGGDGARGLYLDGLSAGDTALLDLYEDGFGYETRAVEVTIEGGARRLAKVFFPLPGFWRAGAPWSLADWAARWGDTVTATAEDIMRLYRGGHRPEEIRARYGQMLMRGGARVRAEAGGAATTLRRRAGADDVAVQRAVQVYASYFSVEEYDLRFRRFDGSMSREVNRAVFISGDAAVVLPYDPVRDRVLLIEQFRMGPYARGDRQPWLLEAVAGRVDGGETPEEAARREAREEAGLDIGRLHPAAHYYPSPAAKGEFLYTYVGIADLPDRPRGIGGLESEAEDIRSHLVGFDDLMRLVETGEINNAPLLLLARWLDRHRADLRAGSAA